MDINFTKVDGAYVSEFEVTADFNLHMDDILLKDVTIYQRSAGTGYDVVRDVPTFPIYAKVFDYDFSALVYPKYIKVVCNTEPSYASVVTDGEITEIKSQSKSVDVTSNGVTEVTPDSGYSYLTGVSVNVNVPQEGGGGGGGEDTMVYLSFPADGGSNTNMRTTAVAYGSCLKMSLGDDRYAIGTIGAAILNNPSVSVAEIATMVVAAGFETSISITEGSQNISMTTIVSMLEQAGCTRITREEFYTI